MCPGTALVASRVRSLRFRIAELSRLREVVGLPPQSDLTEAQWAAISSQLLSEKNRLTDNLAAATKAFTIGRQQPGALRLFNARVGNLEFPLSNSFTLFDTFADLLTQRASPELGPMLAGCDSIAEDALRRNHPSLETVERPLVYCDRGFGASILRQGCFVLPSKRSPLPLIQIPYSRLREKYNLTSVVHEVGHEAMACLGLERISADFLRKAVETAGAPALIGELYSLWSSEIGADFWAFCATGHAQAAGARDVLSLAPRQMFRISKSDPHPPPYLRVLLALEWCKQVYGFGPWEDWRRDWLSLYPIELVPAKTASLMNAALRYLPTVSECLLNAHIPALENRPISSLFQIERLHPDKLRRAIRGSSAGSVHFNGLSPCEQLAAFRVIRNECAVPEERIDSLMTAWLTGLRNGWWSTEKRRSGLGRDSDCHWMQFSSGIEQSSKMVMA